MGKASISIAITSNFNGSGVDAAIRKMEQLSTSAVAANGKFGASAVKAGSDLGKASHLLSNFGQGMARIGDTLTTHVTIPMGIAAVAAVKSAMDIDTAWYNVRKTVDMTEEGYQQLKQGAIELSNVQPVSAETILNIEAMGGQLGISNEKLESFAQTVSGLDIATNLNAEAAATQLARFANIVQMSEDDFDNFGSALVDLGNHSATTESEIMDLALRFASAGHVAGMSNQEILGISASLSSLGMKADAGGSALSQVINKISTDVDTNGQHLEAWAKLAGKSVEDFKRAWKGDAAGTFEDVLKGIARSGDEMNSVLEEAGVTQIRNSDAMRRLASSGDLMRESIDRANTAWQQNTALSREVENRNESLASQFEVIKNRLTNAMAIIGEPIAKMTLQAIDGLDPLIQGAQDLATSFANADPVTQRLAFNLGATAMAAGPVLSVLGRGIDAAGKFGVKIARASQQFGIYTEAMKTSDVAMLQTLASNETFATRLGLTRNALTKAAGGADKLKASVAGATESVKVQATESARARIYAEQLSKGIEQEGKSYEDASKAAYKYLDSSKAEREVKKAQTAAQKNMSRAIMDTTKNTERAKIYSDALTDAIENQGMSYEKAARHANKVVNSSKAQTQVAKAQASALNEVAHSTKEGTQAYSSYMESAEKAHTGLTNLKNVLLGIGGIAIGAAAFAGIEYLATQTQLAFEHAERLRGATDGLREASRSTAVSLDSQATSLDNVSQSQENARARLDALQEAQIQLGEQISETNTNANAQIGALNRAWSTIDQYANKAGLSATEQYKLKQAIDTVNEACGTQYSVVDAANGRIADETGTIQQNTDAIRQNVEAIKQQIELQAIQSNLEGLYAQRLELEREMGTYYQQHADAINKNNELYKEQEQVTTRLKKITDEHGNALKGHEQEVYQLLQRQSELNNEIDHSVDIYNEQKQTLSAVEDEIGYYTDKLVNATENTDNLGNSIKSLLEGTGKSFYFKENLDEFSAACEDAGLTVKDFEGMSRDTLEQLASHFDGTVDSILDALGRTEQGREILSRLGYTIDEAGNHISKLYEQFSSSKDWTGAFEGAAHGLDEFATKCQQAGINFESLNALGSDNIKALAKNFDGSARSIVQSLQGMGEQGQAILNNIGQNWYNGLDGSTQKLVDSVRNTRNLTNAEIMALAQDLQVRGQEATRFFVEGLNSGASPEDAASAARKITDAFKEGLSPEQASAVASSYSRALADHMNPQDAADKATQAVQQIIEATQGLDPGIAAAVMNAYSAAINNGVSIDDASTKIQEGVNRINNSTANLSPEQAAAAIQAFVNAINSGVSLEEAVNQVNNGMQSIEEATSGLDPGVASAAMEAFVQALNSGATVPEAAEKVRELIQEINNAPQELSPEDAAAAMRTFVDALNNGADLTGATEALKQKIQQMVSDAQATLNNASFDGSGFVMKFAELGNTGPQAFNTSLQGWGPIISDTGQFVVDSATNSVNPHTEVWTSKGNEGPQAYNNALSPWGSILFGTGSEISNQAISGLQLGIPGASTAGSETGSGYANTIGVSESIAYSAALATQMGVVGAYQLGVIVAGLAGTATGAAYTGNLTMSGAGALTAGQAIASAAVGGLSFGTTVAMTTGTTTGTNYVVGLQGSNFGAMAAGQAIASAAVGGLSYGSTTAMITGTTTGTNYVVGVQGQSGAALGAGQTVASSAIGGLDSGAGPAMTSGTTTGTNYVTGIQAQSGPAGDAARSVANSAVDGLNTSKGKATDAGNSTGSNYVKALRGHIGPAKTAGTQIASAAKSGLASFTHDAYHSGNAMGLNFAAGVWAGGQKAIDNARSIASAVAAILHHSTPKEGPLRDDDVWGYHFAQNLAEGIEKGTPAIAAAASNVAATMAAPVKEAVSNYANVQKALTKTSAPINTGALITNSQLNRYSTYASAINRSSDAYRAGESIVKNYTSETINSSAPDYDTVFRVVEAAVVSAIKKSGGLTPVIELDGRQVSKQLVHSMDTELGRLQRSRG